MSTKLLSALATGYVNTYAKLPTWERPAFVDRLRYHRDHLLGDERHVAREALAGIEGAPS